MKVKDVMTPNAQTCLPETSLATAAMMMWESDCGVLPVVNVSDKVVGMIATFAWAPQANIATHQR